MHQNMGDVAISSGEAELYAIVKGGQQGIGMQSLLADLQVDVGIQLYTDASAAKGMVKRKGIGKVKHIEVNQLWIQDYVAQGLIHISIVDQLG